MIPRLPSELARAGRLGWQRRPALEVPPSSPMLRIGQGRVTLYKSTQR